MVLMEMDLKLDYQVKPEGFAEFMRLADKRSMFEGKNLSTLLQNEEFSRCMRRFKSNDNLKMIQHEDGPYSNIEDNDKIQSIEEAV